MSGLFQFGSFLRCLLVAAVALSAAGSRSAAQTFDLRQLGPIVDDHATPASNRIETAIGFLKAELNAPSKSSWGTGGGPVDSGYFQSQIVHALFFPGAEAPGVLRKYRDAASGRLKDLLTIPLGALGARDTIPDLMRIAREDPEGKIRQYAVRALTELLKPRRPTDVPQRVLADKEWRPYDAKTLKAITETMFAALQDPCKHYYGVRQDEGSAFNPVQEQAIDGLQILGLVVTPVPTGWRVDDSKGIFVRMVKSKRAPKTGRRSTVMSP